jgi:imidazole glycerol phosphate synthase subunit HisF
MNMVRIVPCLDMKDGIVVKGRQCENLRAARDPVETAKLIAVKPLMHLSFSISALLFRRNICT